MWGTLKSYLARGRMPVVPHSEDIFQLDPIFGGADGHGAIEKEPLVELYMGNGDSKAGIHESASYVGVVLDIVHEDAAPVELLKVLDHLWYMSPQELAGGYQFFDEGTEWLRLPFRSFFRVSAPVFQARLIGQSPFHGRVEFQIAITLDGEMLLSDLFQPRICPAFATNWMALRFDLAVRRNNVVWVFIRHGEVEFVRELELCPEVRKTRGVRRHDRE